MALERTLSIIKPNAVEKNVIGQIYDCFERNGLRIIAAKMCHLSRKEASDFYAIHQGKSFFEHLIEFMTSGPIMVQVLEGENAILKNRVLMGNVDPQKAEIDTLRAKFGQSVTKNGIHGSDTTNNAEIEIYYFFAKKNLVNRGL